MKITKIEPQKNSNRVNIYIDGEFAFSIFKEIQYKYNLMEDREIDKKFINEVLLKEERLKAKNKALSLLSYRQRTSKEITDKLTKEGFSKETINETIEFLKEYKLIDDLAFAKSFMEAKVKKYGPNKIKYDLYKKGIPKDIIHEVLNDYTSSDEYAQALELAKKKIKSYKGEDKKSKYRKLGSFLQRKGFSYECILKVLKDLI